MNAPRPKILDINPCQDNQKIAGKKCEFVVPAYGQLKMLFLLFDVVAGSAITSVDPTSFVFVENAQLLVNNTHVIAQVNDVSSLSRLDTMDQTEFNYIYSNASASIAGGINTIEKTLSFPLFFWPIDGQMINTDVYDLRVKMRVKDTFAKMGLNGPLTTFNVRLRAVYDNYKPVELNLAKSYNSFYLPSTEIASGSTSYRTFINLPYSVYSMAFLVRKSAGQASVKINKVVLKFPNGAEETYDQLSNYFIGTKLADKSYIFSVVINDKFSSEVISSNRPYTILATVYYTDPLEDANLFISYDYFSNVTEHSDNSLGTKFLIEENNISY